MAIIRKRLIFWLIKAYIKKSGKTLVIFFLLGLIIFAGIAYSSRYFAQIVPFAKKQTVGVVGAYTQDNLPPEIVNKLSSGLTELGADGTVQPKLAASWEIQDNGKKYIFHLKKNQFFYNGKAITSHSINYDFADVTTDKPDDYTLIYRLKDAYSPFLVTVTKPVFDYGYIGSGDYRVEKVERNGSFVQSLTIAAVKNRQNTITYEFYPTEDALKLAYMLGEISEAQGVTDGSFNKASFATFQNTKVAQHADYSRLVTLFFNTIDADLSDKKLRLGLSYGIPDTFKQGIRAYLPYSPKSSFYNSDVEIRKLDYNHAKLLMLSTEGASTSAQKSLPSTLTIKTLQKYATVAQTIADSWKNLGIKTKVEIVDTVPNNFQIFLGEFNVPKDPDQYTLWHSNSKNNITHYKNLRIDKLLEDGRKTVDSKERKKLYDDFQKYLTDDAPAAFLYFPTSYTIVRK